MQNRRAKAASARWSRGNHDAKTMHKPLDRHHTFSTTLQTKIAMHRCTTISLRAEPQDQSRVRASVNVAAQSSSMQNRRAKAASARWSGSNPNSNTTHKPLDRHHTLSTRLQTKLRCTGAIVLYLFAQNRRAKAASARWSTNRLCIGFASGSFSDQRADAAFALRFCVKEGCAATLTECRTAGPKPRPHVGQHHCTIFLHAETQGQNRVRTLGREPFAHRFCIGVIP